MASGKSALARDISAAWNLKLLDLDRIIEAEEGESISEIIFNKGELYFRKKERAMLELLLNEDDFVLATGGGTPCYYDNMTLINSKAVSFYLKHSIPTLYNRLLIDRRERPLIAHLKEEDLKEFIAKHLFERSVYYEQAIFTLDSKLAFEGAYLGEMQKLLKD